MNKIEKKERNSNIELLRIIAMVMIVMHHYSIHGGLFGIEEISFNKYIGGIIYSGGKIGVNIFMLISGYFLIYSKFNIKKVLKLFFQVLFYSICFLFAGYIFKGECNNDVIKKSIFPITYGTYWFITIYIGIYFLSPFINKLSKSLKQREFELILLIFIVLFTILQTDAGVSRYLGDLEWFIFMYMFGAYIRLFDFHKIDKKYITLGTLLMGTLIIFRVIIITYNSKEDFNIFSKIIQYSRMNNWLILLFSIFIFLFFKNLNLKNNRIVNYMGKTSFAVYLFHDNLFKDYFWKNICKVDVFYNANALALIMHLLICTITIYFVVAIIEYLRKKIIEDNIFKITKFDKYFDKIDKLMNV